MNILVTGANGQLGECLKDVVAAHGNGEPNAVVGERDYWIFADRQTLDITDYDAVREYVSKNFINVIVNCAAYTNVGKAEEDVENSLNVNVRGAEALAAACKINGAVLIHISTDYVFDGSKNTPYTPSDEANPLNIYGKHKYEGERAIEEQGGKYLIFRTSWLYSEYGKNFVKTIAKRALAGDSSSVVYDQVGSPTYAGDLARFIYHIITDNDAETRYLSRTGVYHFSNRGIASWYDLAHLTYTLTGDIDKVSAKRTPEDDAVRRPAYSVMDTSLTEEVFNWKISHWEDAFLSAIKKIIEHVKNGE